MPKREPIETDPTIEDMNDNPWKGEAPKLDAKPAGPRRAVDLLKEFEEFIGKPLVRLEDPQLVTIEDGQRVPWPWSWDPQTCAAFMAEWDSSIYVMHPNLRELAQTQAPGKPRLLYEMACQVAVRQRIDGIFSTTEASESNIPPLPKGPCRIDLRESPPFGKPGLFTINSWKFYGMVTGISYELREQLAYMLSQYLEEGRRMVMPYDHQDVDLGRVSATS